MNEETASPQVSDDEFLGGALHVLQPRNALRSGVDAVLLAASVKPGIGAAVLDAGAGVGVVGLSVARRCSWVHVTFVEREPELARLARVNCERNGLAASTRVICADLTSPGAQLAGTGLEAGSFDCVLANQPFHEVAAVRASPRPLKASASVLDPDDLERWLRFLASMARPGGQLALIHRAEALSQVLAAIGSRFGGLSLLPVHPHAGEDAIRILVRGTKGSRAPLRLLPGLVLHERNGGFTTSVNAILRGTEGLERA